MNVDLATITTKEHPSIGNEGVATADIGVSLPQHQQQMQLNIEPDYAATDGTDLPEEAVLDKTLAADLAQLTDEELILLAQARFSGQEVPQSVALKVPNLMKQFEQEARDAEPKSALVSAIVTGAEAVKDVAVGASVGAASGVLSTATAVVDGLNWLDDAAGWDFIANEGVERVRERTDAAQAVMESWIPESFLGQMSGSLGRFGVGLSAASGATSLIEKTTQGRNLITGLKMLVSPRTASVVGGMAKGVVASTAAFSPDDARFADLIQQFPQLKNPLTDYLAAEGNEDDSLAEKRFKQALDSIFGDVLAEGVIRGISKAVKVFKHGGASAKSTAEATKLLDEADKALAIKSAQTVDNGVANKGGVVAGGQQLAAEDGHRPSNGNRPRRGKGKIQYEDARTGAGQGGVQAVDPGDAGVAPRVGDAPGDGMVPQDGVPVTASPVPNASGPSPAAAPQTVFDEQKALPDFDEDAALSRAQRLYAQGAKDGGTPYEFRPTHDVTNAKYYNDVLLQDGGVARLLELGNETEFNVLERPRMEFNTKPLEETAQEARDILNAYAERRGVFDELSKTAEFAEGLARKVVMARDAVAQGAYVLGGVLKRLDDPALDAAARKALIDGEAKTALRNYATLASYFDRISTGTARALNAHKIKGELSESMQRILTTVDAMDPDSVVGLMRRVAVADNPLKGAKMLRVVSHTRGQKFVGMLTEYWINSILSGITTNTVNFTSNLVKAGVIQPLDNLVMGWGGFDGGLLHIGNREAWNQGVYAWWGMAEALKESWDMAVKSFKLGSNILKADNSFIEQQARKISSAYAGVAKETAIGRFLDGFGKAVNLPTRFLMAADEFASQMAYRANTRIHLMTKAHELFEKGAGDGLTKKAFVEKYIKENFDSFFTDAVSGSGEVVKGGTGTFKQGLDAAMEATYTKPLVKDSLGETLQHAVAKHPLLQHIIPFVRTPMNILDDALIRIPGLNLLSAEFRAARREGGEAWARAQAKLTVGSAFCGVAAMLCLSGRITGSAPKDKATRDALLATGWRPNSIHVGGKYISYSRIEPLASVLSSIADAGAIMTAAYNEVDPDSSFMDVAGSAAMAAILGVSKNLTSKTYMAGLADFLEVATSDDGDKVSRWVARRGASYVPNIVGSGRKMFDPTMNEARTFIDMCKDKVPGLSSSLPPRYSWITGQPIQYMGGRASGFSPVVWESDKNDPVLEELAKVATAISAPSDRVNGVKLSGQQLSDYHRLHGSVQLGGKTMLEALRASMKSTEPVNEEDDVEGNTSPRVIRFNAIIKQYRDKAKKELIALYPDELMTNRYTRQQTMMAEERDQRYRVDTSPGAFTRRTKAFEAIARF